MALIPGRSLNRIEPEMVNNKHYTVIFAVMTSQEIVSAVKQVLYQQFSGEATGHDYFHVERVVRTAIQMARQENADLFLVELTAWLHDVGDYKLNNGIDRSQEQITAILMPLKVSQETISRIIDIVSQVSFSKGKTAESLEAKIVQDADRLDALGAVGIARTFAYGGSKKREIYNPHHSQGTSVQHFYDKLLLLKDRMNTSSGKAIAEERHRFLEKFLQQFYKEWNGESEISSC